MSAVFSPSRFEVWFLSFCCQIPPFSSNTRSSSLSFPLSSSFLISISISFFLTVCFNSNSLYPFSPLFSISFFFPCLSTVCFGKSFFFFSSLIHTPGPDALLTSTNSQPAFSSLSFLILISKTISLSPFRSPRSFAKSTPKLISYVCSISQSLSHSIPTNMLSGSPIYLEELLYSIVSCQHNHNFSFFKKN